MIFIEFVTIKYIDYIKVFIMMIQRSVKNQLIVDLARPVPRNDFTSTKNVKRAGRLFIPDVVAIATDSRLSNLALTLALGVSSGCEITNKFLILFLLLQIYSFVAVSSAAFLTIFIKVLVSISQFFIHILKCIRILS